MQLINNDNNIAMDPNYYPEGGKKSRGFQENGLSPK